MADLNNPNITYIPSNTVMSSSTATATGANPTPHNHLGSSFPTAELGATTTNTATYSHAGTDPEKGGLSGLAPTGAREPAAADEEDDEDIDALIDELASQDGLPEEEEEVTEVGGARPVAEELLNTDTRCGLTEQEVTSRRRKFGLNQLKEEKENLILKFLMYFVGPIQFVMEVRGPGRRSPALAPSLSFAALARSAPIGCVVLPRTHPLRNGRNRVRSSLAPHPTDRERTWADVHRSI